MYTTAVPLRLESSPPSPGEVSLFLMKGILRESLKLLLGPRFSDPEYFCEEREGRGKKEMGYNKTGPQGASEMACIIIIHVVK